VTLQIYLSLTFLVHTINVMTNIGFKRLQYSPKYQTFTSIQVWRNINEYK
jgi:hypothetical protein